MGVLKFCLDLVPPKLTIETMYLSKTTKIVENLVQAHRIFGICLRRLFPVLRSQENARWREIVETETRLFWREYSFILFLFHSKNIIEKFENRNIRKSPSMAIMWNKKLHFPKIYIFLEKDTFHFGLQCHALCAV